MEGPLPVLEGGQEANRREQRPRSWMLTPGLEPCRTPVGPGTKPCCVHVKGMTGSKV